MSKKKWIKRAGFTLVEIMIVLSMIALLTAIAVPGFLRARKRSQVLAGSASYAKRDIPLFDTGKDLFGR